MLGHRIYHDKISKAKLALELLLVGGANEIPNAANSNITTHLELLEGEKLALTVVKGGDRVRNIRVGDLPVNHHTVQRLALGNVFATFAWSCPNDQEDGQTFSFMLKAAMKYDIRVVRDSTQRVFDPFAYLYDSINFSGSSDDGIDINGCGGSGDPQFTVQPGCADCDITLVIGVNENYGCPSGGFLYSVEVDPLPIGSFSLDPTCSLSFKSVSHRECENFAVHARTTVTFDSVTSTIHHGDVGVSPGTSVTGAFKFDNWNATGAFTINKG